MATTNYIRKVALVGTDPQSTGNVGRHIASALLATGRHSITALTRPASAPPPAGITPVVVDYEKPESLVDALRGHDALVLTLSGAVPKDTESKLIQAAGEAGVGWVLPNEWSPDTGNEGMVKDVMVMAPKVAHRKEILELGKSAFISVVTGFWYEWSLAIGPAFGIDMKNKHVTFFDDGNTPISISTWPQVGRAVAALLSLPITPEEGKGKDACLEAYRNKVVYVNSFTTTQREMFASVLRVTGTKEDEWKVESEGSKERYEAGMEGVKKGEKIGFAKMLYARQFFQDGTGDFEHGKGTLNSVLGLPKEKMDEYTRVALERTKEEGWLEK